MSSEYEVELAEQETNGKRRRGSKEGTEMSGKNKKFFPAPDVEDLARELIEEYHSVLRDAKIRYVFRDGTWNKDGKPCPGEAKKMSPLVNALTEIDFDGLNQAIKDLQDAVGPLASFMSKFR